MTEALYQLLSWFSPSFPTGSYVYSHGLESAIDDGKVRCREDLSEWIRGVTNFGDVFQDGIILKEAYNAFNHVEPLKNIIIFAIASRVSYEKAQEDESQANAFVKNVLYTESLPPLTNFIQKCKEWQFLLSYPVVCGIAAAAKGASVNDTILAYVHSFVANMVSVAVKSIPLGQSDGLWVLMKAESNVYSNIKRILETSLEESGSANFLLDIYSSRHEKQKGRLFRS